MWLLFLLFMLLLDTLIQQNVTVSLFDTQSCLDTTARAGVQLNQGLVILGQINLIAQQAVITAGLPTWCIATSIG